jgi:hypothetical protein
MQIRRMARFPDGNRELLLTPHTGFQMRLSGHPSIRVRRRFQLRKIGI